MHSLITSYLLQCKECILPGIGILQIIHTPVTPDVVNNRLLPPMEEIIFRKETHSKSPGLVKYISDKKHIEQSESEDLLNDFCNEWKEKINAGEKLHFETIGSIQKNSKGIIIFEKENSFSYFQPITVNDPFIRTEKPLSIEEPLMSEVFEERDEDIVVERTYWGLLALILLAIGAVMLFYHFKDHKLSASSIGNQQHFVTDSASATYILQK